MYESRSSRPDATARQHLVAVVALLSVFAPAELLHAQNTGAGTIDELLETLSSSTSVKVRKIEELPPNVQGQLVALAEFDEESQSWKPMDGPQDFGLATPDRITVLGYAVGQDGFIEGQYVEITDRRVVSYTGVTADRRLSINLYEDESDPEHLVLQIRIGPRQLRYLLRRPMQDE